MFTSQIGSSICMTLARLGNSKGFDTSIYSYSLELLLFTYVSILLYKPQMVMSIKYPFNILNQVYL